MEDPPIVGVALGRYFQTVHSQRHFSDKASERASESGLGRTEFCIRWNLVVEEKVFPFTDWRTKTILTRQLLHTPAADPLPPSFISPDLVTL